MTQRPTPQRAPSGGHRRSTTVTTAALAVLGAVLLGAGVAGQEVAPGVEAAPQVEAAPAPAAVEQVAAPAAPAPAASVPASDRGPATTGPLLDAARPVAVSLPSIGAGSPRLVSLGLEPDGAMEVPRDFDLAGWYRYGPTPGELGPAVIAGHVDSAAEGPAVFFRLAALRPGDEVVVDRADGRQAVFTVERVEQHPKDGFPTLEVFGDTDHAALRLVTCGGRIDTATGHYRDNVIAYARLTAVR